MNKLAFKLEQLSSGYNGVPILRGINMTITKGEKCVLTGSNGCGKSTLLKTVLGLHPPMNGIIRILGYALPELRKPAVRRLCAYINQHMICSTLPVSAREVVAMGLAGLRFKKAGKEQRIAEAMETTGTLTLAKKPYNELSGGQKQRIHISRCLAQGAEILFLDEPLSSLDPESKVSIVNALARLPQTVLAVSHEQDKFDVQQWKFYTLENGVIL